jgi:adenylate cyclase class 2
MLLEVEQKFPLGDLAAMRQSLAHLGASFEPAIEQADVYFAHPCRDFKETDEALRIRRVGEDNFVTYKGPKLDAITKTRREIEFPLAAGDAGFRSFAELLEVLGFLRVFEVRKERVPGTLTWEGTEVHVSLDTVVGLGTYLELEVVTDDAEAEAAKVCLASLANRLQLSQSERRGYLDLLINEQRLNR